MQMRCACCVFILLPHLLPFWLLFVGGSPPSAWHACSKRKCIACQDCLAEDAKKGSPFWLSPSSHACKNKSGCQDYLAEDPKKCCFLGSSTKQSSHTHKARSMQDAACVSLHRPFFVCLVTMHECIRALFWCFGPGNLRAHKPRSMQHAFAALTLACVSGDHELQELTIRHAESAWPGPSITIGIYVFVLN